MITQATLDRVAMLQNQLHNAIVEETRNLYNKRSTNMNTILRKAGQVAKKVNEVVIKPVQSMMAFAHKTGRIHICVQCAAEYFNNEPTTCDHCKGETFIMSSSLAKVDETLALYRAAHPVEVIDGTTGHVAHA